MLIKQPRRKAKAGELMLVPMIDIFTVLVTFLLMTAVFSRITIVQLDLPSAAARRAAEPEFRLEVIVRREGFELTNGSQLIAAIPKVDAEYDLKALSQLALALKREHPKTDNASVLMEGNVEYDNLIQVMDAIRSTEAPADTANPQLAAAQVRDVQGEFQPAGDAKPMRVALFTKIAVGDAP